MENKEAQNGKSTQLRRTECGFRRKFFETTIRSRDTPSKIEYIGAYRTQLMALTQIIGEKHGNRDIDLVRIPREQSALNGAQKSENGVGFE